MQPRSRRRVVIVGAGPAGARCAERLAHAADVTLIGAEPPHPYNRVALSLLLAGKIDEAALTTHPAEVLATHGITWLPKTRVTGIDRAGPAVLLQDGTQFRYDALVLATGARAVRLALPGADQPHVLMYRTLADVRDMIEHARIGGAAVVIGGGLLGLEAAAGLAWRGMAVTVLHGADRLMNRQLDAGAAELLRQRLAGQGIDVIVNARTVAIEADAVLLADGTRVPARIVVMAVGIQPEASLGQAAGLAVDRGILVDETMRTGDPAIWAIGECCEYAGQCVGLVAPAFAQAEVAAAAILGQAAKYIPVSDAAALKVAGAGVWSAGETEGDDPIVLDDAEAGQYRRLLVRDDRLVGAMLYGDTADAPWYLDLIKQQRELGAARLALPFGPAFAPPELTNTEWAA
jgi:nitrite reductase (NADH) large subunit